MAATSMAGCSGTNDNTVDASSSNGGIVNQSTVNQSTDDVEFIPERYIIGEEISTPTGRRNWVPIVPEDKLPFNGMVFNSLMEAHKFYKQYARIAGFEVRKSTQKRVKGKRGDMDAAVKLKYYVCSKEGKNKKKENSVTDTLQPDNNYTEVNDNAVNQPSKIRRQRSSQRTGCLASIRLEINANNKYEIYVFREHHNHPLVHPDYRKHLKSYRKLDFSQKALIHKMGEAGIGPVVAHRVLSKFAGGPDNLGASKVEFKNYKRDVLAFIGQYDCQMVVDMMRKRKESLDDFSFDYFLDADGRLGGMFWADEYSKRNFVAFGDVIIKEFHLEHNKWLEDMFHLREFWIPAYFTEWEMSGLMRTSSRSESENNMFGQLMDSSSTLVEFFSHFDTAMISQRFEQSKNDHDTRYTSPELGSDLGFEKDAMMLYTRTVYLEVKAEIQKSIQKCMSLSYEEDNGCKKFKIVDTSVFSTSIDESIDRVANPDYFDEFFPSHSEVVFNSSIDEIFCSCKRYERFGLLCRHIFYVLRLCKVECFPKKYICKRWTRDVLPQSRVTCEFSMDAFDNAEVIREIRYNVDSCIGRLIGDKDKLLEYLKKQKDIYNSLESSQVPVPGNKEFICAMVGVEQPKEIEVEAPVNIRNKGSGRRKRLQSSRELSMKEKTVKRRTCSYCGLKEHNTRGCPKRKKDDTERRNGQDGGNLSASNDN